MSAECSKLSEGLVLVPFLRRSAGWGLIASGRSFPSQHTYGDQRCIYPAWMVTDTLDTITLSSLFALWVLWSAEIWPVKSRPNWNRTLRFRKASPGTRRYVCADQFSVFGDTIVNQCICDVFCSLFLLFIRQCEPQPDKEAEALRRDPQACRHCGTASVDHRPL